MKFKNIETGNIVRANNESTIELMKNSPQYEPVPEKQADGGMKSGKDKK